MNVIVLMPKNYISLYGTYEWTAPHSIWEWRMSQEAVSVFVSKIRSKSIPGSDSSAYTVK